MSSIASCSARMRELVALELHLPARDVDRRAMICRFGEVEVCVKKASLNGRLDRVEVLVGDDDRSSPAATTTSTCAPSRSRRRGSSRRPGRGEQLRIQPTGIERIERRRAASSARLVFASVRRAAEQLAQLGGARPSPSDGAGTARSARIRTTPRPRGRSGRA